MIYLSNKLKVCPLLEEHETNFEAEIDPSGLIISELIEALKKQNNVGLTWIANQVLMREQFWNNQIEKE